MDQAHCAEREQMQQDDVPFTCKANNLRLYLIIFMSSARVVS